MKISSRRKRWTLAAIAVLAASTAVATNQALARAAADAPGAASGLGQLTGLLPHDHLTVESALQVDLSKQTVRLPLYPGKANGQTVWYVLLDSSDAGLAHDLGINYAPKLANIATGCPDCVQTVTLESPTPAQNPFGPAVVDFQGAPDFSPTRIATPGPNGFPLAAFQPGAVAGSGYSPFVKIAGSDVVYSAPIVATGDGPFDVVASHRHRRPRLGSPHRRTLCTRPVRRVLGRPAVCQRLRRRPADRLHQHRRRTAAHRGLGALNLRASPRPGRLQRRRRLPRLRPRTALRVHQRPDRHRQQERARVHPPRHGRPRVRGRQRRQHRADQRAA